MEVLISTAVLSLILASTFTLANRASATTRTAQERGEASKIAISQLETLKAFMKFSSDNLPVEGGRFCLKEGPSGSIDKKSVSSVDSNGVITDTGTICKDSYYNFYITRGSGDYKDVYTSSVVWEAVSGGKYNRLDMPYRLYADTEE